MIVSHYHHRMDKTEAYYVDFGSDRIWVRFTRPLDAAEQQMLATVAQLGVLEAVRALELPFWDVPLHGGGQSWVNIG